MLSSESDGAGCVLVKFGSVDADGVRTVAELSADEAMAFAAGLISSAREASRFRIDAWRRGDCPTCGNVRLVDALIGTRTQKISCPDCSNAPSEDAYPTWKRRRS